MNNSGDRSQILKKGGEQQVNPPPTLQAEDGSLVGCIFLQMQAIQRVHGALRQEDLPAPLITFVHDKLVLEVRKDTVDDVGGLLIHEMTQAFLDLFKPYQPETMMRHLVEVSDGQNYTETK